MMKIRNQKDFEKLRALALMSEVISKAEMEAYFETCYFYLDNKCEEFILFAIRSSSKRW